MRNDATPRSRNAEALCVIERSRRLRTTQLYAIRACELTQQSTQKRQRRPLLRNAHPKSLYCVTVRTAHRDTASNNDEMERGAPRPPPSPEGQNRVEGVTILETPVRDDGFIDFTRKSSSRAHSNPIRRSGYAFAPTRLRTHTPQPQRT